ncbi:MAG: hypothetical protein Q8M71_05745 [Thermodesulfovibrionales bacterium]|nr:hypothetical protein [Thermodesulfovibrionales bacterium]
MPNDENILMPLPIAYSMNDIEVIPPSEEKTSGNIIAYYKAGQLKDTIAYEEFIDQFQKRVSKIIRVSDEVISSLKKTLDYNGYYTSFLLNQLTEKEFEKISRKYTVKLVSKESDKIKEKVRILFVISKEKYTPSDLSNIFKIEESIAEKILNEFKNKKYLESSNNY